MRVLLVNRSTAPPPDDQVLRGDETARLRDALNKLPMDAKVALLMAAEGFSSTEIGEAIGRTAGATATYICRARIRLRDHLSAEGEGRDD
jgi:DNA-directed RNA polymerase specialized sigma24 family protein